MPWGVHPTVSRTHDAYLMFMKLAVHKGNPMPESPSGSQEVSPEDNHTVDARLPRSAVADADISSSARCVLSVTLGTRLLDQNALSSALPSVPIIIMSTPRR